MWRVAGSLTGSARSWCCVAVLAAASVACSERCAVPAAHTELTLEANPSSSLLDMKSQHARHAATTLADSRVLVCGGSLDGNRPPLSGCDLYEPLKGEWSAI